MQDNFAECERRVRDADKDRFLTSLFAPAKRRGPLLALYAFNAEIARVRDVVREPMAGEIRLQWWKEVVGGTRAAEGRGHPVAAALLDVIVRFRLPPASLVDLIEARSFDLYDDPIVDLAELEGYAAKTSSVLIELAARILADGRDPAVSGAARPAGIAYAICGLLRALPVQSARHQLFIPLELLQRHGAEPADFWAGRPTPQLRAALTALRGEARRHLAAFAKDADAVPPALLPAFLPVALVRPALAQMERQRDPLRPSDLPQWRRQWLLWRAARAQSVA